MTTISWEMQGGFKESDFRNLDPGIKKQNQHINHDAKPIITRETIPKKLKGDILAANQLDLELYNYIKCCSRRINEKGLILTAL